MTSLQDLVTSNVPDSVPEAVSSFEPLAPLEVAIQKPHISYQDLLDLCQMLRKQIEEDPSGVPYKTAQLTAYLGRHSLGFGGIPGSQNLFHVLFLAVTYAEDPCDDHRQSLLEWIEDLEEDISLKKFASQRNKIIGNTVTQIDFLRDFFGDDLPEELSFVCGVKRPTAKRWLEGKDPSWNNQQPIRLLARVFYAAEKAGLSHEEILLWYREPFEGTPPREHFRGFYSLIGKDFRAALDAVGFRGDNH